MTKMSLKDQSLFSLTKSVDSTLVVEQNFLVRFLILYHDDTCFTVTADKRFFIAPKVVAMIESAFTNVDNELIIRNTFAFVLTEKLRHGRH